MNKNFSKVLILLFVISYISPTIGSAIDPTTSGRILDNFKAEQSDILFESAPFEIRDASKILEDEYAMNGLESLKNRLQTMQWVYQTKKDAIGEVRVSLEQALAVLTESIRVTSESITQTNLDIKIKQTRIQQLQSDGLILRTRIREHRSIILAYLKNIYSEWNAIIDTVGNIDLIKSMILTTEDSDFTLSDITYKTLITQMGQQFVDEYRALVRAYYLSSIQSQNEQSALETLRLGLENQSMTLESQKSEREKLLEITQWQEALYVQYIASQQTAQAQVEVLWKEASDRYSESFDLLLAKYNCNKTKKTDTQIVECARIRQYFINEKELAKWEKRVDTPNIFDWPVSSRRITTYFHDADYYQALHSQHEAIDIATPQGSDISAPADGYVTYILPPVPGWYSYMAIKHADWLLTVYGHLSEVLVSKYEFVKRWQIIAKSGGAVGTPGAGPMTSGAHLHFEVWSNRESVDPLRYLSLASMDYATLLPLYQDKFLTDIVELSGTGTDTTGYKKKFNLVGTDETERQKYLLATYATPDFNQWQMWVDTALDAHIDPSFMICIGLAETTLGNHLKTPYNIGNIGNTDSGSTYSFASPAEWLEWMTATFNNKYLGKYTHLSELSRWGNPNWAIYASSNSNWHNNTIRCLSALKGEFVKDDFEFRIK